MHPKVKVELEPLMSYDEAAKILDLKKSSIVRLVAHGELRAVQVNQNRRKIEPAELRRYIESNRVEH